MRKAEISKLQKIVKSKISGLSKDKTPLDVLYWLIQEKKQVKFSFIARIFNVKIKKIEEWAKILESHELAEISYPAFGVPILKIKKNKAEAGKIEQTTNTQKVKVQNAQKEKAHKGEKAQHAAKDLKAGKVKKAK